MLPSKHKIRNLLVCLCKFLGFALKSHKKKHSDSCTHTHKTQISKKFIFIFKLMSKSAVSFIVEWAIQILVSRPSFPSVCLKLLISTLMRSQRVHLSFRLYLTRFFIGHIFNGPVFHIHAISLARQKKKQKKQNAKSLTNIRMINKCANSSEKSYQENVLPSKCKSKWMQANCLT